MIKTCIYQVSAEDLKQFGLDLIASYRESENAENKTDDELKSVQDTAQFLQVTEQTVRNMIARGNIRTVRVGRRVMVDMGRLRQDVARGKVGRGKHTTKRR